MNEKEVIIGEHKIKTIEKRHSDGPVVVFLHGWGSNYHAFHSACQHLENYFAFDFPGFGGSSTLKNPLTLSDYADVLSAVTKRLGDRKIIVVAHSFGGRVLVKLLSRDKLENITQIICIGVPFVRDLNPKKKAATTITKLFKGAVQLLPNKAAERIKKRWHEAIGASDYASINNEALKKTFINIINEDIAPMTDSLKGYNTHFIWGEDDEQAPLSGAQMIAKKTGAQLHIIKKAGHFPFVGETTSEFKILFDQIISS